MYYSCYRPKSGQFSLARNANLIKFEKKNAFLSNTLSYLKAK